MAWRETRGGWRHFAVFFGCVTLGVGALVGVGTLATNLERTLAREAKALMGGDLELRGARALPPEAEAALGGLERAGAAVVRVRELVAMARHPERGDALLVELKAVDAAYPLYGRLEARPDGPPAALLRDGRVLVEAALLERLGLAVGERVAVGQATFRIAGVLVREPDRAATLLTLGPRVLLDHADLAATGLVRVGSRVRHRALVRLPPGLDARAAREDLGRRFADPAVRVAAYDEARPGLRRFFEQTTTYLGLVGLASLLVGGIGVASSVTTFLRRQQPTIAILKAVGADARTLTATYLGQTVGIGLVGSLAGAALGVLVQPVLAALLAGLVPFPLPVEPEPWTVARGLLMGLGTTVLCAAWPLARVRDVRPSILLRRDVDPAAWRPDRPGRVGLPVALGLVLLSLWQARSLALGAIFLGASAAALACLWALGRALGAWARRRRGGRSPAWRHGLAGLRRPGGETARTVVALGVGVMLLVAVALLERSLGRQIDHERRQEAPSFFFIDVQPDQRAAFTALLAGAANGREPALTPVVRGRLAAVDGAPVTRAEVDARAARGDERTWYLTREYVLTWAAEAPAHNALTRGRWWTEAEAAARPRASVEEGAARYLGVGVGSRLTFDVQGVPVEAEVMSVRRVDWQSLSTNFFVILSPGALDGAPTTYVATARVPAAAEAGLQRAVVRAFPNVTAVPVRDVLERVGAVLGEIAVAVRLIALFTVGTGLAVMSGALTATRYQRLYESVVLRTLGATRGTLARAFAVEYACVGAAAGLGGTALAAVLAWIVLRFVLDVPWTFEPAALAAGVAATVAGAVAVGFLATFRLLGEKPLPVLRRE
jgi:putative ABC transport system permease protein